VLIILLLGYTGYYVCRSNLSIAAVPLSAEFGLTKAALGRIGSVGLLAYAIGKVVLGMACDFVGGRRIFLLGMLGSVGFTVLFAAAPSLFGAQAAGALFLVIWLLNRFVQSPGWGAVVKVSSRWFPIAQHGRVMAILSLSYLFGDVVARQFLGELLSLGLGWRAMFYIAAATLAVIALATWVLLKPSPAAIGLPEPIANPDNFFGPGGQSERPQNLFELLEPFVASASFWLICLISIGLTLIRESFSFWIPTYLVESASLTAGSAGKLSAWFPLFGGIAALLAGFATDRFVSHSRAKVMVPLLALLIVPLVALSLLPNRGSAVLPLACFAGTSFLLMGPYTFLTGVLALDFGGKRGSATAAGLVDGAGYLGAAIALEYAGWGAEHFGWPVVFTAAAGVAALTAVAGVAYWLLDESRRQAIRENELPLVPLSMDAVSGD
jgi:OPA family glycerol-3-phosphate transporter-like MFS transporter